MNSTKITRLLSDQFFPYLEPSVEEVWDKTKLRSRLLREIFTWPQLFKDWIYPEYLADNLTNY